MEVIGDLARDGVHGLDEVYVLYETQEIEDAYKESANIATWYFKGSEDEQMTTSCRCPICEYASVWRNSSSSPSTTTTAMTWWNCVAEQRSRQ